MHSEDDDFSLHPSSSSKKLASLFEKSNVTAGGNSSLMYKAPKQPRSLKQHQIQKVNASGEKCVVSSNEDNVVLLVTAVQAFRLEDNKYNPQGKAGAAIVASNNYTQHQLILYRSKSDFIAQAVINSQFWFSVHANNYLTFYDKHQVTWSLLFESSDSAVEFITQITVVKWNKDGKSVLFAQDLVVVESERSVESGDNINVSYVAFLLLPDNKFEKRIDSNENDQIHVVSNNDVTIQSWESLLIGMSVGSKKLIILPSTQLDRWKKYVPQNDKTCAVLLTVLVNEISKLEVDKMSSNLESRVDCNIKTKSECIKDALTSSLNSSSSRANLISRMAKMGQPTLPLKGARVATSGISDSSETEEDGLSSTSLSDSMLKTGSSYSSKSRIKQVPLHQDLKNLPNVAYHQSSAPSGSTQSTFSSQLPSFQTNLESGVNSFALTRPFMYDGSFIQPSNVTAGNFNSVADSQIPVFLSELRTHNAELRMNINRISDKIDRVIDKVDCTDPMNKILDHLLLMEQNIFSHFSSINQQTTEINDAIKKCGIRPPKASSSLPKSDDQHCQVEKENVDLLAALSESRSTLIELQGKLDQLETIKLDLQVQLAKEKENRIVLEKDHLLLVKKYQDQSKSCDKIFKNWNSLADKTSTTILELEKKVEEKQKTYPKNKDDDIKKIMKSVFKNLVDRFPHDSTVYSASEIHSVLADVIKASTLKYIQSKAVSSNNECSTDRAQETLEKAKENTTVENETVESTKETNSSIVVVGPEDKDITNMKSAECPANFSIDTADKRDSDEGNHVLKNSDANIATNVRLGSSSELTTILKDAGDIEDNSSIKSCVDEFLKMKDEVVKKLDNYSKRESSTITKEFHGGCNMEEETEGMREQSPCVSNISAATNDTADENWRSQPPPLLFDEEDKDTDDDWLKM